MESIISRWAAREIARARACIQASARPPFDPSPLPPGRPLMPYAPCAIVAGRSIHYRVFICIHCGGRSYSCEKAAGE